MPLISNFPAGGSLNKSIIIVTAPTGSAVTATKGSITKTTTEKNGEWWFKNLDIGTWALKATLGGQTATDTVNVTQLDVYRITMAYFKATINVTYPAGSTCTATDGHTTLKAPDTSGRWTCVVPNAGNWTITSTLGGQTDTKVVSISSDGQSVSVALSYRSTPEFTYTGNCQIVQDNDAAIPDFASWKGNWKIRFLTSGIFTVTNMHGWTDNHIDVFLVGGGGSGAWYDGKAGGGGAGGYTLTKKRIAINTQTPYSITIGAGAPSQSAQNHGTLPGNDGGNTTAFGFTANGGGGSTHLNGADGGSGGAGAGGNGGSDGGDGTTTSSHQPYRGMGQISTPGPNGETGNTREFGESTGKLYSGGGKSASGTAGAGGGGTGAANTGGGGNNMTGSEPSSASRQANVGGSGIVVIRNAR